MQTYEDKNFNVRLEVKVKNAELVKARETLGLNQKQAAELIGISNTYLVQIELLHQYPKRKMQEKICSAYRNAGYFILEEDVFPEILKNVKLKGKYIAEREVPESNLISLSDISQKLLPQVESEAIKEIYNEQMHSEIAGVLSRLDERKRTAVKMYFGIDYVKEYTFDEIASVLGVGRSRVGQMVKTALSELRRPGIKSKLVEFARNIE